MIRNPFLGTLRHQRRYRQILGVLADHGFGAVLAQLGVSERFNLPHRLLRRQPTRQEVLTAPRNLRLAIEELGPTFIKLGQILSTRSDILPREYVAELSLLQDRVPPADWDTVREVIESELGGPIDEVFEAIDHESLASASLAQVHAARLRDGTDVVVKVQRPGIEQTVEEDLAIFTGLAHVAQQRTPIGQRIDVHELALEFGSALRGELDFRREGRNADRFRENFRSETYVRVPAVHWQWTRQRMMVQERLDGIKLDDIEAIEAAAMDRHALADHAARIVLKEVLIDGFFHADPHPGNLLALPGNGIGLLDFGTVGRLDTRDRLALARLFVMVVQLDVDGAVEQLQRMGFAAWAVDRDGLVRDLRRLFVRYYGLSLQDIPSAEVMHELEPVIQKHGLRVPADFMLLAKTIIEMQGVGLALDPSYDMLTTARPYIRRLLVQWALPTTWAPSVMRTAADWAYLGGLLPRQAVRILGLVERGDLEIQAEVSQLGEIFARIEGIANRIIYGVLLAAFTVALAMLTPRLDLTWPWHLVTWIIVTGFFITAFLALQLLWSIFRSARKWNGRHRP